MAKEMMMDEGMMKKHMKMHAWKMLILGLLVLANVYWLMVNWFSFVGIILVLAGLMKMFMPCGCHK